MTGHTGHISEVIVLTGVDMTFKPNKDSEPLSEASPGPQDVARGDALEHELRFAGAFEGEDEDALRATALADIAKIVTDWAAGFYERQGIPVPDDGKKMAVIIPFGSYALGCVALPPSPPPSPTPLPTCIRIIAALPPHAPPSVLPRRLIGTMPCLLMGAFSRLSRVHSTDSDIDVLAIMPKHVSRNDFLSELGPILRAHSSVDNLSVVPEAFVPVIKFNWEGIDMDLSFAQILLSELPVPLDVTDTELLRDQKDPKDVTCLNGPRVTYEILRRVRNVNHFRTFLRALKMWARRRGIYSNIVGFPGGVAWAIMAANVCQLYPNMSPPMLLEKFFFLYQNWNFDEIPIKIASVDECRPPPGAGYMPQWSPNAIYRPLQIITPTYPVANATFNACHSTVAIVRHEIGRGHGLIQGVASGKHGYAALFNPSDFFAQYKNYVCVDCFSDSLDDLKPFYGYLSSQIRKLVEKLEGDEMAMLEIAHPCTTHFGPRQVDPPQGGASHHPTFRVHFYVGLKFDEALVRRKKEAGETVNLTAVRSTTLDDSAIMHALALLALARVGRHDEPFCPAFFSLVPLRVVLLASPEAS